MVTDNTCSTQSSEPMTAAHNTRGPLTDPFASIRKQSAVRETRTPPKFSAPASSIAARIAAVTYHPQLGSGAAWDAAQWRIALAKASSDQLCAASNVMPDGPAKDAVAKSCHDSDAEYSAAVHAALGMPAPHHGALLWKMQYFLEAGADGFNAQYRADALKPLFDDVARFAASEASPTRLHSEWATARAAYVVAREGEAEADAQDDNAASDRWAKRRYDAEDALMAIPSPDAAAFAFKFLVAHGGGRQTDCWNDLLEAEALRFAQQEG